MKKTISIILAIMMVATLSISAFAADVTELNGTTSTDVNATYATEAGVTNDYKVVITWGAMDFTYTVASQTWNADELKWEYGEGEWTSTDNSITVVNHSNVNLDVEFTFAGEGDVEGSAAKVTAPAATVGAAGAQVTSALNITAGSITATGKIGTLTATVKAAA